MSATYTSPDDWLLTHHAHDADLSTASSLFYQHGLNNDNSVPISALFSATKRSKNQTLLFRPQAPPQSSQGLDSDNSVPIDALFTSRSSPRTKNRNTSVATVPSISSSSSVSMSQKQIADSSRNSNSSLSSRRSRPHQNRVIRNSHVAS